MSIIVNVIFMYLLIFIRFRLEMLELHPQKNLMKILLTLRNRLQTWYFSVFILTVCYAYLLHVLSKSDPSPQVPGSRVGELLPLNSNADISMSVDQSGAGVVVGAGAGAGAGAAEKSGTSDAKTPEELSHSNYGHEHISDEAHDELDETPPVHLRHPEKPGIMAELVNYVRQKVTKLLYRQSCLFLHNLLY